MCARARVCAGVCVCVRACVHACVRVCMHLCVCVCTYVCLGMQAYMFMCLITTFWFLSYFRSFSKVAYAKEITLNKTISPTKKYNITSVQYILYMCVGVSVWVWGCVVYRIQKNVKFRPIKHLGYCVVL